LQIDKLSEDGISEVKKNILFLNTKIRENSFLAPKDNKSITVADFSSREGYYLEDKSIIQRAIITLKGKGCSWARNHDGGCTMCGHTAGSYNDKTINDNILKKQFDSVFDKLNFKKYPIVCIYNGGSFFNKDEVSDDLKNYIFRRIGSQKSIRRVVFESRTEFITDEILNEIETFLPSIVTEIGVGLESSNDIVRNLILNKGTSLEFYRELSSKMKNRKGIKLLFYVLLKPPFLTEVEAINDAISTIEFARSIGVDIISIEPVSVQDYTLVSYLYEKGLYSTPWIWSVFEVLKKAYTKDINFRIGGFQFYPRPKQVVSNCDVCNNDMLLGIEEFNRTNNLEIIEKLNCNNNCKREWLDLLNDANEKDLLQRINIAIKVN